MEHDETTNPWKVISVRTSSWNPDTAVRVWEADYTSEAAAKQAIRDHPTKIMHQRHIAVRKSAVEHTINSIEPKEDRRTVIWL